jgi:quinoprotein glucose dehydrogenase
MFHPMKTHPPLDLFVHRLTALSLAALLTLSAGNLAQAETSRTAPPVDPAPAYDPTAPANFDEADKAIAHFKKPADLKVTTWAAEPQMINPVAMNIDTRGRIWVVETNRYRQGGVLDIRNIYDWVDEDLACRTVADRNAMVKRHWPDSWKELTKNSDRIRLLEDSSGGGKCDHAVIWADGFSALDDGIASGVLEHKGNVYFTDIPNLWVLRDAKGEGVSTERKVMSTGYGIRYSFEGHDLHGLRLGPDGKLYFSCGDRGFNVTTKEGKQLAYPDTGGVLRCDPDGANLEVFAYGLRNPQKLCFDDHGNLYTGDNNSDHGDPAKWFYVVEGADCGWRVGYQHITKPRATGALLMESVMATEKDTNLFYNTPPIAHIGNGPSGCTFYPGTGMPEAFNGHFLLCDFKGGTTNSGVWSFTMKPHGASFTMEDRQQYLWQILPTDVEFGTDGGFYVSDWTNGWARPNKGRIYRFFNEEAARQPLVSKTRALLSEGFEKLNIKDLGHLLSHIDQRVRLEAQYELASRGAAAMTALVAIANQPTGPASATAREDLGRLHAIWGLGQIARKLPGASDALIALLKDADAEVRAQAAKVLGESRNAGAYESLIALLKDDNLRVQFFAAQALGKIGNKSAVPALIELLGRNADHDAYVRHACFTAMAALDDKTAVLSAASSENASIRMGVLETLRRMESPEVARFLTDADPKIVLEAARAVNDVPIEGARPALAKLIANPKLAAPVLRRAINANFREGKPENIAAIAKFAGDATASDALRAEAIDAVAEWEKPSLRDHVMGMIWPLPDKIRDGKVAADAIKPYLAGIVKTSGNALRIAALSLAEKIGIDPLDTAYDLVADTKLSPEVRAAALKVLAAQKSPKLEAALKLGLLDSKAAALRKEAIYLQTTQPDAVAKLNAILADASPADQQAVFSALPLVGGQAADTILAHWMDQLIAGKAPAASMLDLLEAAARSKSPMVTAKVRQYDALRKKEDTLSPWRECLEGGDAAAGKRIFFEKQEVSCVRCHMIGKEGGGNVGPNLIDLGKRQGREYILESIVLPNAKIAPGYESAGVKLNDGKFLVGVVKNETDDGFQLDTGVDQGIVTIKKSDIKFRKPAPSPMPDDIAKPLTKQELRNLVEYLSSQKG